MALSPKRSRSSSQRQSQSLGDQLRKAVSTQLREAAREAKKARKKAATQRKLATKRRFRHAVAVLKRKGFLPKTIDARKIVPSSSLRKTIRKNQDVLKGEATGYKLPPDFPKQALADLKKAGYRVSKGRLVLPKGQYSRGGKIYQKPVGKRAGGQIETIVLNENFEQQIRDAFASLKSGQWIGFSLDGHNSYNIYQSAEAMLADLHRYAVELLQRGVYSHLTIFRTKHPTEYLQQRSRERLSMNEARDRRRNQRRRLKRRQRKAMEQGMRVVR